MYCTYIQNNFGNKNPEYTPASRVNSHSFLVNMLTLLLSLIVSLWTTVTCFVTLQPISYKSISRCNSFTTTVVLNNRNYNYNNQINDNKLSRSFQIKLSSTDEIVPEEKQGFDISPWLSTNTRGGVLVWSALLTLIPIGFYYYFIGQGLEDTTVGAYVGAIFVLLSNVLWASTYIFRVANKDMTYAKQLRDYENAVLQKRLEELADDEINALMEEIEKEENKNVIASTTTIL